MFVNVQFLRMLAASSVVLFHTNIKYDGNHTQFGSVEIFFICLISILVMPNSTSKINNYLILMGDASYSCYLLHTILIEWLRAKHISPGSLFYSILLLTISWLLALIWCVLIEKPLTSQLKKW